MSVTVTLEQPIPLLGLRSQRLGYVHRLWLALESRRVERLELHTPWQTLRLPGERVIFDAEAGLFRMKPRVNAQAGASPASAS